MEHPKNCLVCLIHKPTARLENWSYAPGDQVIWGAVYGDINERWRDGEVIRTSLIVNLDLESGHVRTLNSLYILGKREVVTEINLDART